MRLPSVFSFRVLRFVLAAVVVWILLAWAAAEGLIVRASLAHADAIVVLSGSNAYVERTARAIELFREGLRCKALDHPPRVSSFVKTTSGARPSRKSSTARAVRST